MHDEQTCMTTQGLAVIMLVLVVPVPAAEPMAIVAHALLPHINAIYVHRHVLALAAREDLTCLRDSDSALQHGHEQRGVDRHACAPMDPHRSPLDARSFGAKEIALLSAAESRGAQCSAGGGGGRVAPTRLAAWTTRVGSLRGVNVACSLDVAASGRSLCGARRGLTAASLRCFLTGHKF